MKRTTILPLLLGFGLASGGSLAAWAAGDHGAHAAASATTATSGATMTEGEIRKVDKDTGKLTIKHAELKNLGMPPMTMVFQVKDKAILERVNPGDPVNFVAEQIDGKLTVTQIAPRK